MSDAPNELLGAHVSTAGGVANAPARGVEIGATAIQIFTKTPNQWRDPALDAAEVARFKAEVRRCGIQATVSHDSYLTNLASPDPGLRAKSTLAFKRELVRCQTLGIPYVVAHPGNFIDDREAGLRRNAEAYVECLSVVSGPTVLIETMAGAGTGLGSTFQELAALRRLVPAPLRQRIGFCADTCHLFVAGYDLITQWDAVWHEWGSTIGLQHLKCLHLNDSKNSLGSRRDRHEWIGEGALGPEPFRRVMQDRRFRGIIKIIETPKGDEPMSHDKRMLRRLRAYGRETYRRKTG